jgi:hypothetical protein
MLTYAFLTHLALSVNQGFCSGFLGKRRGGGKRRVRVTLGGETGAWASSPLRPLPSRFPVPRSPSRVRARPRACATRTRACVSSPYRRACVPLRPLPSRFPVARQGPACKKKNSWIVQFSFFFLKKKHHNSTDNDSNVTGAGGLKRALSHTPPRLRSRAALDPSECLLPFTTVS